ncbi:MAG: PAS domain-containing protein [Armatimonadota bacterium]|nr:MAG: PAS domain-containing protein [Armatimonadota bacterium]
MTEQATPGRQEEEIQEELERLRARIAELQEAKRQLEAELRDTSSGAPAPITTAAELDATLRWFLRRVGMILQAEKAVLMLYEPETGELVAQSPALGLTQDEVEIFRVRATQGISGQVFREGRPIITDDATSDPRTVKENVALLNVRNVLTVPLVVERKDAEGMVVERNNIGVFHVFNKRANGRFAEEDVTLIIALAKSAASVISSAKLYIAVADEKRELERTLQGMLAGVLVVDSDGHIRLMNSAAKHMFGVSADDGTGKPLSQVIRDEEVHELIRSCLSGNAEASAELSVASPEERIFQVQTAMLRGDNDDISGVVATFNDITELRSVERMKSEFVSTVSHELRTPLTSIKGFIRTLLDDTEGYYDRVTQTEFYRIIDTECDRLVRLISDLLNLSRIESGRALDLVLTSVDLGEVVNQVIDSQRSYTNRHEFEIILQDDLPRIVVDRDKVDQILTNLLSNAIKYSPDGGTITVRVQEADGKMAVSVTDEGIGIPEEHIGRLFTRFHRVDSRDSRKQYGTGIGLYLVKHLVEAHHGEVSVESKLGKGSTFTFVLPTDLSREQSGLESAGESAAASTAEPAGGPAADEPS